LEVAIISFARKALTAHECQHQDHARINKIAIIVFLFASSIYLKRLFEYRILRVLSCQKRVTEEFRWRETIVFKVMAKCCVDRPNEFTSVNLKTDPERGELREQYDAVQPGYHMNKKHWIRWTMMVVRKAPGAGLRLLMSCIQGLSKRNN